jgi:predicted flap endonuclease-1-like 5' DNA nuclease
MSQSTILIIGAAIVVLALVFLVLARTGRKPPVPPVGADTPGSIDAATALSPVMPNEPLPEPGAAVAAGISAAELEPSVQPVAPDGPPDPLTRLKGLGPPAEATLLGLGVTRYAQIAAWSDADVARIDAQMGAFKGRIARDRWIEQARYLAADDVPGFEAVFGKLG